MKPSHLILTAAFALLQISNIHGQYCMPFEIVEIDFQAETKFVNVEADWYPSWIEYNQGKVVYPNALDPLTKWKHPYMKDNLPSAMHEDSYASDISNLQGPVPEMLQFNIFKSKKRGKNFRVCVLLLRLLMNTPWLLYHLEEPTPHYS